MAEKEFIVAIELGSSKVTGIAGQKKPDGSINVLALVKEDSSQFIRKGVVYNIDKTAQCLTNIIKKMETQLKTRITQVFVGVGGQSIRGVRNVVAKDMPDDTIITQEMVAELMEENRNLDYPDQKILDVAEQEYKVDTVMQLDPVGIRASHLEGNYLNILERKSFFQNLNKCFETAGIKVVEMYLAPLALANAVLTEAEKRSGCALIDLGADTTTVSVFYRNVLRHLAVIPLGANNITKDIAQPLQMEESEAEKMKLKYASAYTDNNEIDDTLKYSIDQERQVESRKFIDIVEGRLEEIILNVREQIPNEYCDKLLGGIILTGGGSNLKNIERAFAIHTHFDKIRIAKFVTLSISSNNELIKNHNGMMNTLLGLLAKGYINCAGNEIDPNRDLFEDDNNVYQANGQTERTPRQAHEVGPGVILTEQEEKLAEEEARRKREEQERQEEQERLEREKAERLEREEAERKRKENSWWNKLRRGLTDFGEKMVSDE
ncbi:cell division protein FtsA [Prevotella sp. E13-27]|uniref:cell division protein FtsA n=1 Tax=Prevotella sp. E13-27 TaxID=2938122 RepID=UPI002009E32D|nr:cell division protein FtsA [Prevotella sp. E13-27]MCK8621860.1 cell division protein FtsA [Prevotella sp. E13-27]